MKENKAIHKQKENREFQRQNTNIAALKSSSKCFDIASLLIISKNSIN
jgi:hypothetical protein